jgi:CRISPR-associated protein Csm4
MALYRSTILLQSASASLWQADTLFGHLCWSLARRKGEEFLNDLFLADYRQNRPPILLSDGFPADYLPRPLLPRGFASSGMAKRDRLEVQRAAKTLAHVEWLTLQEFNQMRRGELVEQATVTDEKIFAAMRFQVTAKNQIERLTNTAGAEGGALYDMEEFVIPRVTVYWRIEDGYLGLVRDFLTDLQKTGYGKRKSVGYGQVERFTLDACDDFPEVSGANGFVSLSRFVPAPRDPTEGFWSTAVKYGKLGEEWALDANPFKRPLIQLACGSCFRDPSPRPWYGQLVRGLSVRPEVEEYAFALAVPMRFPEGA